MKNSLSSPLYVSIDITNKCNLRCIHCRAEASIEKKDEIPFKNLKKLIKELSKMKVIKLVFSGGEPFIRKDIFDILSFAVQKNIPEVAVVTNGTLLNKNKITKLKKTKIKHINVSLEGMKLTHEKIRGKGTFDIVIKNVKELIKNKFKVGIVITLSKLNYKDIPVLIPFLNNLGVNHIEIGNLMPFGRGSNLKKFMLNYKERMEIYKIVKKFKEIYSKISIDFESSFLIKPKILKDEKKIIPFMGCRAGRTMCSILSNGDVVGCKLLPHIVAGNIFRESFKEIWEKDDKWIEFREDTIPAECANCKFAKACRGGCKALSYAFYTSLKKRDPRCINGPF